MKINKNFIYVIFSIGICVLGISAIFIKVTSNKPKPNTPYLTTYNNDDAIFIAEDKSVTGTVYTKGITYTSVDFNQLVSPKKIDFKMHADYLSFKYNNSRNVLYISIVEPEGEKIVNKIYQTQMKSFVTKEIWRNEIGSNKYSAKGVAELIDVPGNKYLVVSMGQCYPCGGYQFPYTLILDIESKKEKFLGQVGNLKVDEEMQKVTYQKLSLSYESCDPEPMVCGAGKKPVMKPKGKEYTESLL